MFDSKYLNSIIILLGVLSVIFITTIIYTILIDKSKNNTFSINLREYTLYIKYNVQFC